MNEVQRERKRIGIEFGTNWLLGSLGGALGGALFGGVGGLIVGALFGGVLAPTTKSYSTGLFVIDVPALLPLIGNLVGGVVFAILGVWFGSLFAQSLVLKRYLPQVRGWVWAGLLSIILAEVAGFISAAGLQALIVGPPATLAGDRPLRILQVMLEPLAFGLAAGVVAGLVQGAALRRAGINLHHWVAAQIVGWTVAAYLMSEYQYDTTTTYAFAPESMGPVSVFVSILALIVSWIAGATIFARPMRSLRQQGTE